MGAVVPADGGELPAWLQDLMSEALGSDEWEELSKKVMQEVEDKLQRRGLRFFSDLPETDKAMFVDEIEQDLLEDASYGVFFRRLGGSLDRHLLATAMKGEEVATALPETLDRPNSFEIQS